MLSIQILDRRSILTENSWMAHLVKITVLIAISVSGSFGCRATDSPPAVSYDEALHVRDVLDLHRKCVRNFVFCPSSRRLFVSYTDDSNCIGMLYEWDIDSKTLVHTYPFGNDCIVDGVYVSPDGNYLLVACFPHDGNECGAFILNAKGQDRREIQFSYSVSKASFNRQGTLVLVRSVLALGDGDACSKVFDMAGREERNCDMREFTSPGSTSIWRIESTKDTLHTHGLYYRDANGVSRRMTDNEWIDNYALTGDGANIAATTWDGELIVWRAKDQHQVLCVRLAQAYGYLAYDPDLNCVYIGDATGGTSWVRGVQLPKSSR
jgi:WD40 repeat protein